MMRGRRADLCQPVSLQERQKIEVKTAVQFSAPNLCRKGTLGGRTLLRQHLLDRPVVDLRYLLVGLTVLQILIGEAERVLGLVESLRTKREHLQSGRILRHQVVG